VQTRAQSLPANMEQNSNGGIAGDAQLGQSRCSCSLLPTLVAKGCAPTPDHSELICWCGEGSMNRIIMGCSNEGEGIGRKDEAPAVGAGASKRQREGRDEMTTKSK
jgi:hypothetical protein